ncbi:MAG: tRNA pseudouridine(55) synthase TruB [Candidatus Levybacteria bacterium]|nr:tRNA pseudouridine(55) synthase TruB [Candidatus Levybacteria bacterium]
MENIFAVNKPIGMTSHDVVALVRRATGIKRVGHGGTLDPQATGVLVIAVGRENTKLLESYVKGEKEYVATVFLGVNSTTYDEEGEKQNVIVNNIPQLSKIEETIKLFVGNIDQIPPIYSSVKIHGKPAHRRVRSGEQITLNSRAVIIHSIIIDHYSYPILKLKVATGPGVYIRSLAYDIGKELGTGGYLKELIRTRVNNFTLENAKDINDFRERNKEAGKI